MKKVFDFLKNPHILFLIFIVIVAITTLIVGTLLLVPGGISGYMVLGYVMLGIFGLSLGYLIYIFFHYKDQVKDKILKWAENHKFWNNLFHNYGFRTIIFSISSFAINIAFACYNGAIALGIVFSPDVNSTIAIWFAALTAYYLVLIILRGNILIYHRNRKKAISNGQTEIETNIRDTKIYGMCGILLLLLPICLSFAIAQMVAEDAAFVHSGIMIYVYAVYAFYKIIASICNYIKAVKTDEMTVVASRNINLADALVSILALQTAMFREFNNGEESLNAPVMNAVTGAVICALTVAMAIYMIVNMSKKLKKTKSE